jgi:FkbM family methyltransferase
MYIFERLRKLFYSKKLFSNWFSAGIRYYLIKYGLAKDVITIRCGDIKKSIDSKTYLTIINAYYNKLFEELECSDSIYILFTYRGKKIRLYDAFKYLYDIILENFFSDIYDYIDFRDRMVIDVGAGIGDTAILFSFNGARRVIGLEPFTSLYKKALINIKINNVDDKVILLNAALGSLDEVVCIDIDETQNYVMFKPDLKKDCEKNHKIRIYTLASLIREFMIEKDSILKLDCEGCEYEVIRSVTSEDLKIFDKIIIEYHNGYNEIKKILENTGFKTLIKPLRSVSIPIEVQGYIIAERNGFKK